MRLSRVEGRLASRLPPATKPLEFGGRLWWSFTILSAKALVWLLSVLVSASLLNSISSMSLCAASVTKSWVLGAMPEAEFTPVFSGTDWACTG